MVSVHLVEVVPGVDAVVGTEAAAEKTEDVAAATAEDVVEDALHAVEAQAFPALALISLIMKSDFYLYQLSIL